MRLKKIAVPLCVMLGLGLLISLCPKQARADVSGPTVSLGLDPNTPAAVQRIADGLHVFDNATPLTGYDITTGNWLAGASSTVYKRWYVTVDMGGQASMTANASLNFLTGARLHAGELAYDRIPQFQSLVDQWNLKDGLFKYAAAGAFVSRDWTAKHTSYGPYAGIEYRFH